MELRKKTIRVVGTAIIDNGKILVAQRQYSDKAYKSLKWEFPGGKIEAGESEKEAIQREIQEELDCNIEVDAFLPEIEHEYPDFRPLSTKNVNVRVAEVAQIFVFERLSIACYAIEPIENRRMPLKPIQYEPKAERWAASASER